MKKLIAGLLAGILALSMTACGNGSSGQPAQGAASGETKTDTKAEKLSVTFITKSLADQHWQLVKTGAEAAAKELGVDLKFTAPNSESDVAVQVDMVHDAISAGTNAICIAPCQPDAVVSALEEAGQKNIPVLLIDTDAPYDKKACYMGTGNEAAASLGGEYIAKEIGKGGKAVIIRGRLGDNTHEQRTAGITKALKAGGVEILDVQSGDSTADKAMNVMEDFLQKYNDIDAVLTTADLMAQGAQRAIETSGRKIKVMGFDGTAPVVDMVIQGTVDGTVAQNPYRMGYQGVQDAVRAIKGEKLEAVIDTGATLVVKDNAEQFKKELEEKIKK